ncbi:MAG: class I mannose-6-phosphate isomerase [Phycisphaerae bacterium]
MKTRAIPVVFRPILKPKPWGGQKLAQLFGKALPPGGRLGESWELSDLPENESVVRDGPQQGRTIRELVSEWGADLLGRAALVDGRFPLLIKFLDARENLSIQVHPKPAPESSPTPVAGVKHEAWYVVQADEEAGILLGVKPEVDIHDVRRSLGTAELVPLLRRWRVRTGDSFYLPSGVPHALCAGVVAAEVQTPSDVTYRMYDWDRVDESGQPRPLHLSEAMTNLRLDVTPAELKPPRSHSAGPHALVTRVAACPSFLVSRVRLAAGLQQALPDTEMLIWILLNGSGALLRAGEFRVPFTAGDTVLIPAANDGIRIETADDIQFLEVSVPIPRIGRTADREPAHAGRRGPLTQLRTPGNSLLGGKS